MTQKPIASKEGALSWDKYEPGGSLRADQSIVELPGYLINGYGRYEAHTCFCGGINVQDSTSNVVIVQPQALLGTRETVVDRLSF